MTTPSLQHSILSGFLALACLLTPAGIAASSAQDADQISTDQIFSVTTGDWNKDGAQDAVIMIETEAQEFDVLFYLTDEELRLKLHDRVPSMVWGSSIMFGQEPSVSTRENGSLLVTSQNSGIGRNRWEQVLTVVYRENRFIVAGFTYNYYDTLDPDAGGACDLNLLTGKGVVDDEPVGFDHKPVSILDFPDKSDELRKFCGEPQ